MTRQLQTRHTESLLAIKTVFERPISGVFISKIVHKEQGELE